MFQWILPLLIFNSFCNFYAHFTGSSIRLCSSAVSMSAYARATTVTGFSKIVDNPKLSSSLLRTLTFDPAVRGQLTQTVEDPYSFHALTLSSPHEIIGANYVSVQLDCPHFFTTYNFVDKIKQANEAYRIQGCKRDLRIWLYNIVADKEIFISRNKNRLSAAQQTPLRDLLFFNYTCDAYQFLKLLENDGDPHTWDPYSPTKAAGFLRNHSSNSKEWKVCLREVLLPGYDGPLPDSQKMFPSHNLNFPLLLSEDTWFRSLEGAHRVGRIEGSESELQKSILSALNLENWNENHIKRYLKELQMHSNE